MAELRQQQAPATPVRRPELIRLAYRLLGSVEEAEDVVQDAHVKLLAGGHQPDDAGAWLFRTVTNLAIDRLRHLKVRRRAYAGPWLPEPLATEPGAEDALALQGDLSLGFLLLLERLSVGERAVFVLREALELDFQEIAAVLGISRVACRQRYRRARQRLADAPHTPSPPRTQRRALERLVQAVGEGDAERVAALLADDVVLLTDGGGRVSAAIQPVHDPRRVARVLVHLAGREDLTGVTFSFRSLNGGVGLIVRDSVHGSVSSAVQVDVSASGIQRIYVVRNPGKLMRLGAD